MRKVIVTANTEEALTVDEVKSFALRQASNADDAWIERLIVSARLAYEEFTGRVLMSSTWDIYYDSFDDELELPSPLISITSVKYQDTSDVQQTLAAATYQYDIYSEPARLRLAYGQVWPTCYGEMNDIVIRCAAGYANAASVPDVIKDGMYLYIQQIYDGPQEGAFAGSTTQKMKVAEMLWWSHRIVPL